MSDKTVIGRPRQFDPEEALEQILGVFWTKGFAATSIDDLMAATGLKKGSLYAAFNGKRAMYERALALYDRTVVSEAVSVLKSDSSAAGRIDRFLQFAIDPVLRNGDRRGCFLCNAAVDRAVLDGPARDRVESGLARLAAALRTAVADAGISGRDRAPRAAHLLSVYFGLRVLAKGGFSARALSATKTAAMAPYLADG